ncbi:NADH-quinone oxidoreductase subunit L [Ralstonia pickettii]|uniref:Probable inorganic carbon transporter subunit DabB n=1 Tax=Ralstonia pickettii TaxID=329 RepID=A0A2N4TLR0_RALPI|nr:NADH-quinone oxidoreductase subunit L [Ralstonia pickettii]PLC40633.1 NADH-quinone oxidoreductase subunit L [Ralstonia pickettii]
MDTTHVLTAVLPLLPAGLMSLTALLPRSERAGTQAHWHGFIGLSACALCASIFSLGWITWHSGEIPTSSVIAPWLRFSLIGGWTSVLVQLLGTCIGAFSARYLHGERGQLRFLAALAAVLASVHVLLLADHWVVLIAAWATIGTALQRLLCFYPDRPFAMLAAHKKRLADRLADVFLVIAAGLAWHEVGNGSLSQLWLHIASEGCSASLQISAVCIAVGVALRTALLPVHGWLIQVMEAPTPVSALLHAGVVNLGGYVLIRFSPLLSHSTPARWLLIALGLVTAVMGGLIMLTRISIKVRLAWSTVAQMGFMVMECGLGLYTLAALHLLGHSLYKAHAFLSASSVVDQLRVDQLVGPEKPSHLSLFAAPAITTCVVLLLHSIANQPPWPWWWSGILALAFAPLLWLPSAKEQQISAVLPARLVASLTGIAGLMAAALVLHLLPTGIADSADTRGGITALVGMTAMYCVLVALQTSPLALAALRRACYAGFYLDEFYTRLALRSWPTRWTPSRADVYPLAAARTAVANPKH